MRNCLPVSHVLFKKWQDSGRKPRVAKADCGLLACADVDGGNRNVLPEHCGPKRFSDLAVKI